MVLFSEIWILIYMILCYTFDMHTSIRDSLISCRCRLNADKIQQQQSVVRLQLYQSDKTQALTFVKFISK